LRPGRHSLRACLLAALLVPSGLVRAETPQAPPKVLVDLIEAPDMVVPRGPLPLGLRFALYDDGEILVRLPTYRESSPQFQTGRLTLAETKKIRSRIANELVDLDPTLTGDHSWTDQGSTLIDVWDSGLQRYRGAATYGMPCGAPTGETAPDRRLTDPKFLEVCDWLLRYQIASPSKWVPDGVTLFLGVSDLPPKHVFVWQGKAPFVQIEENVYISNHFQTRDLPQELLSALLVSNSAVNWDSGLRLPDGRIATIEDWYFDLPGRIP
jgi:hypothetical protein